MTTICNYTCIYTFPIGKLEVTAEDDAITGIRFTDGTPSTPCSGTPPAVIILAVKWLQDYFNGKIPQNMPPIKQQGTPFQKEVWQELLKIDYGETVTYGDIAKRVAERRGIKKMSAQAVGQALSKNPIIIMVPCHRVIGNNGKLTGYAGGVEKKHFLLKLEKTLLKVK